MKTYTVNIDNTWRYPKATVSLALKESLEVLHHPERHLENVARLVRTYKAKTMCKYIGY